MTVPLAEPARIIDCHVHVFDPARFPYAPDTFYAPAGQELGTPARLAAVLDWHGVEHALLVGPNSGYGEDNRCLLDAIATGGGRYRAWPWCATTSPAPGSPRCRPQVPEDVDRRRILWDNPCREFGFPS
ncbi:amidohydrolase family protein [Pseudonocardia sp. GCM10023141]|uniref:amidohydrolase family protein n=1 Tax=Pseudonocardia sp. GCM10023141 TaxID=3252653 RepID=UPI0036D2D54B